MNFPRESDEAVFSPDKKASEASISSSPSSSVKESSHLRENLMLRSEILKNELKKVFEAALQNVKNLKNLEGLFLSDPQIDIFEAYNLEQIIELFGLDPDPDSAFVVSASLFTKPFADKTSESAFSAMRTVFFDRKSLEWKVYRGGLQVVESLRGTGIGSLLTEAEEKAYRDSGIMEMLVSAEDTVGTYFNAQQGFDFADEDMKSKVNARFISFVLQHGIAVLRFKGQKENLWPLKRTYTAHELSQMEAFTSDGQEILIDADRPKTTEEMSEIPEIFVTRCGFEGTSPQLIEALKPLLFNPLTFYSLQRGRSPDQLGEACKRYFQMRLWYKNGLDPSIRSEFAAFLTNSESLEIFVKTLKELLSGKILDKSGKVLSIFTPKKYSIGKAFFLDLGPTSAFPDGWRGKRRLSV